MLSVYKEGFVHILSLTKKPFIALERKLLACKPCLSTITTTTIIQNVFSQFSLLLYLLFSTTSSSYHSRKLILLNMVNVTSVLLSAISTQLFWNQSTYAFPVQKLKMKHNFFYWSQRYFFQFLSFTLSFYFFNKNCILSKICLPKKILSNGRLSFMYCNDLIYICVLDLVVHPWPCSTHVNDCVFLFLILLGSVPSQYYYFNHTMRIQNTLCSRIHYAEATLTLVGWCLNVTTKTAVTVCQHIISVNHLCNICNQRNVFITRIYDNLYNIELKLKLY